MLRSKGVDIEFRSGMAEDLLPEYARLDMHICQNTASWLGFRDPFKRAFKMRMGRMRLAAERIEDPNVEFFDHVP